MTNVVAASLVFGGGLDRAGWESADLLDRFWDSVAIQVGEPANFRNSLQDFDDVAFDSASMPTPEIFSKAGSNLMINVKADGYMLDGASWAGEQIDPSWCTLPARGLFTQDHHAQHHTYGDVESPQPASTPVALTISPSIAVQRQSESFRRPRLAIPNNEKRRSEGITSPCSALLNLASEFLGAIVRVGRSQPSTPAAQLIDDTVSIMTSDVSIRVVDEDDSRGRQRWEAEIRDCDGVDWVESIPFSAMYSPVPVWGDVMSAKDADFHAKMSWERQLIDAGVL